jgi:hypothetical protein
VYLDQTSQVSTAKRCEDSAPGHEQLTQAALCSRRCRCSHGSKAGHRSSLLLSPLHTMEQDALTWFHYP